MMHARHIEIAVGAFVAAGMAALFLLAMQVSNLSVVGGDEGYQVSARFDNISGLKVRAPVTVAGVRVGRVTAVEFDPNTYQALVTMRIHPRYNQLPLDTSASIFTSGLIGEQYVSLEPGGDMEYLTEGSELILTQSALVLEQLIGQFLFSMGSGDKE
ncbi:MAG: outer membrane lipid asymmetry maintenance protein MlaD [Chromatiales bacterium]|nr:outer membrane lipid asymmetry maintenance protein MlaD [Gammaproteobacteria bacterium]MBW6476226.1 outer membrane lipid asymmetry maintenance protein MlaD [Chromatiales bacterium]